MNVMDLEKYCLSKEGCVKSYPFDEYTAVYKLENKIFALSKDTQVPLRVNLKCTPLYALELRSLYANIIGGYHMNKKHWNTVMMGGDVDEDLLKSLIDDSYALILASLSKKLQAKILLST